MIKPVVHLNGTSGEDLLKGLSAASFALLKAIDLVEEARLHERDTYPFGQEAMALARIEHDARMAKLNSVHRELEELVDSVQAQCMERASRRYPRL